MQAAGGRMEGHITSNFRCIIWSHEVHHVNHTPVLQMYECVCQKCKQLQLYLVTHAVLLTTHSGSEPLSNSQLSLS